MNEQRSNPVSRMLKSTSIYALSGIIRRLSSFILIPIYTRFLTPADYGVVALMIFVISMMETTVGARVGSAIQKYYFDQKTEAKKKQVISTALFISFGISCFFSAILILNREGISGLIYSDYAYKDIVGLFSVLLATQAVEDIGYTFLRILDRPGLFFWFSMLKLAVQIIFNLLFIVQLELGALGMALAAVISSLVLATLQFVYILKKTGFIINTSIAKELVIFSAPLWGAGLVSLYVGSGNRWFMNVFASLDDIGYFSLAERIAAVISSLVFWPVFNYWSAERFRIKDQEDFYKIHGNVFKGTFLLLIIFGLGLSIFSELIIMIFTTDVYLPAAKAVPYLVLAYVIYSMEKFFQFSFYVRGETRVMLKIIIMAAIVASVLNFLLIEKLGFVGAALSLALSYSFVFFLTVRYSSNLFHLHLPVWNLVLTIFISASGYCLSLASPGGVNFGNIAFLGAVWLMTSILMVMMNFKVYDLVVYGKLIFTPVKANVKVEK